jgi:ribosomal protein L7Ae-like RNA K-turn-binding protein
MFLGLATRAGRTTSGDEACREAIRKGLARLVLVAADASPGTRENFRRLCEETGTAYRVYGTKDDLGKFTGKLNRAVVAVVDEGFAGRLLDLVGEDPGRTGDGNAGP